MPYSKKNLASVSATYGENENFFPSVGNNCVLLRRSKLPYGIRPSARAAGLFYAHLLAIVKSIGLRCAVAVMPARTSMVVLSNTASLFCLTFKNTIQ